MAVYDEMSKRTELCKYQLDSNGLIFNPVNYFTDQSHDKVLSLIDGYNFIMSRNINRGNSPLIKEIDEKNCHIDDPNPILVFYTLKNSTGQ